MQFHLNGFRAGDPEVCDPAETYEPSTSADPLPERGRCPDRRLRAGRPDAGGAAGGLSRHQDPHRRAEAGPAAARPGRRHRLPHHGDVRGLRLQRARAEGGLLGQRDVVLEAGRQRRGTGSSAAAGCRMSRTASPSFRTSSSTRRACTISTSDVMRNAPSRLEPNYSRRLLDLQIDTAASAAGGAQPTR